MYPLDTTSSSRLVGRARRQPWWSSYSWDGPLVSRAVRRAQTLRARHLQRALALDFVEHPGDQHRVSDHRVQAVVGVGAVPVGDDRIDPPAGPVEERQPLPAPRAHEGTVAVREPLAAVGEVALRVDDLALQRHRPSRTLPPAAGGEGEGREAEQPGGGRDADGRSG